MKKINMTSANVMSWIVEESKKQDVRCLQAIKIYCQEDDCEEDFNNIILPIYEKYGFKLFNKAMLKWAHCTLTDTPYVEYLNLDSLSCCVYYDDKKKKFVAYNIED